MWSYLLGAVTLFLGLGTTFLSGRDVYWSGRCERYSLFDSKIHYEFGLIEGNIPFARPCDPDHMQHKYREDMHYTDFGECKSTCDISHVDEARMLSTSIPFDRFDRSCHTNSSCQHTSSRTHYGIYVKDGRHHTNATRNATISASEPCTPKYKWVSILGECSFNHEGVPTATATWSCVDTFTSKSVSGRNCPGCTRHKHLPSVACSNHTRHNGSNWSTCWGNCLQGHQKHYAYCASHNGTGCSAHSDIILSSHRQCNFVSNDFCPEGVAIHSGKWHGRFHKDPNTARLHALHTNSTTYATHDGHGNYGHTEISHRARHAFDVRQRIKNKNCTIMEHCDYDTLKIGHCWSFDGDHCVYNELKQCNLTTTSHTLPIHRGKCTCDHRDGGLKCIDRPTFKHRVGNFYDRVVESATSTVDRLLNGKERYESRFVDSVYRDVNSSQHDFARYQNHTLHYYNRAIFFIDQTYRHHNRTHDKLGKRLEVVDNDDRHTLKFHLQRFDAAVVESIIFTKYHIEHEIHKLIDRHHVNRLKHFVENVIEFILLGLVKSVCEPIHETKVLAEHLRSAGHRVIDGIEFKNVGHIFGQHTDKEVRDQLRHDLMERIDFLRHPSNDTSGHDDVVYIPKRVTRQLEGGLDGIVYVPKEVNRQLDDSSKEVSESVVYVPQEVTRQLDNNNREVSESVNYIPDEVTRQLRIHQESELYIQKEHEREVEDAKRKAAEADRIASEAADKADREAAEVRRRVAHEASEAKHRADHENEVLKHNAVDAAVHANHVVDETKAHQQQQEAAAKIKANYEAAAASEVLRLEADDDNQQLHKKN
jgi:hypothetical protein